VASIVHKGNDTIGARNATALTHGAVTRWKHVASIVHKGKDSIGDHVHTPETDGQHRAISDAMAEAIIC
jgi:hypothetical protein